VAVRIKLARKGKKKHPFYRVVVTDIRKARNAGTNIEEIGTYDPMTKPAKVEIDIEKAKNWISKGATPTERVTKILKDAKII